MTHLDIDEYYGDLSLSPQYFKENIYDDFAFDKSISHIVDNLEKFHEQFLNRKSHMEELTKGEESISKTIAAEKEEAEIKNDRPNRNKKIFLCPHNDCGKAYSLERVLQMHLKTHTEKKFYKCHYMNCDKSYKSKENLNLHIKNKHLGMKPYKCSYCDSNFTHRNGN